MPQRSKGIRLWLQPANRREPAVWVIRDGKHKKRTGFRKDQREAAERALADYIASKYEAPRSCRDPREIKVAEVISIYAQDVAGGHARPKETAARLNKLLDFFGEMTLDEVNRRSCKKYCTERGKLAAARRELADLRAAVRHHWQEGRCTALIPVTLPPNATAARERWLTRKEAAKLIWVAWRYRDILRRGDRFATSRVSFWSDFTREPEREPFA